MCDVWGMSLYSLLNNVDRYLSLDRGALGTLKQVCVGLFEAGTVNLQEVCARFKEGNFSSNTRKVERFFANKRLDDLEVLRCVIGQLFEEGEELTLAIDRTEWSFGTTWHNLLCVSVLYGNTAIPLLVMPLERKGNSNHKQRIFLMDQLLSVIPWYRIKAILGDREFIGDAWFHALQERSIPFVMRIRDNITIGTKNYVGTVGNLEIPAQALDHGTVHIGTCHLNFSTPTSNQEIVAVISDGVEKPLALYKKRWGIETGFRCLKSSGFNLEDTHLKKPERIKMLVQICSIAMTLSLQSVKGTKQISNKKNTVIRKTLSLQKQDVSF